MTMTKTPSCAAAICAAAAVLPAPAAVANGGHGTSFGHAGEPAAVERTVRLEAREMAFDRDEIHAEPGETIRFEITNTGTTLHEFTIGPPAVQRRHRREMKEMMQSSSSNMGHTHANATLVEPGETEAVIWHFTKVKTIEFGCNIPGHYEAGMNGDFVSSM